MPTAEWDSLPGPRQPGSRCGGCGYLAGPSAPGSGGRSSASGTEGPGSPPSTGRSAGCRSQSRCRPGCCSPVWRVALRREGPREGVSRWGLATATYLPPTHSRLPSCLFTGREIHSRELRGKCSRSARTAPPQRPVPIAEQHAQGEASPWPVPLSPLPPLSQQPLHPLRGPRGSRISVGWCPLSDRTQMPPEYLLRAERWGSGAGTQRAGGRCRACASH